MELQTVFVDRGQSAGLGAESARPDRLYLAFAARNAVASVDAQLASFWLVVRGRVDVVAREGRFQLHAGDWLSLERESRPWLRLGRGALVVGLGLPAPAQQQLQQLLQVVLHAGRGRVPAHELRPLLRLWRQAAAEGRTAPARIEPVVVANLFWQVAALQKEFQPLMRKCPGRSFRRKQQIFARMQRARLYLEGNMDRAVRVGELAELSNLSVWYFTKIFHALYGEGPQAAAIRLRFARATELLTQTRLSVAEIGMACGFMNNCSFSRAFRSRHGVPPSAFRAAPGAQAA